MFDFAEVSSFVTLITSFTAEPLYFLNVMQKGIFDGILTDTWGHIILPEYCILKEIF